MNNDILKICFSESDIEEITSRLGKEISKDYEGMNPMLICLLKGAVPFMSDLCKHVTIPMTEEFIKVSSYHGGTASSGVVNVRGDIPDVKGKDIILVEDILDTGRTLELVKRLFMEKGAKSIKICVFLDKPEGRVNDVKADYVGALVPNEFVVGYGLDYDELYRNLPYVGVLKEEVYKK